MLSTVPDSYGLPQHLHIDRSSQMPRDVWAAFCMRCTGAMAVKVSDGHEAPEDAALAARLHNMDKHPIAPEDMLTEEEQEEAAALEFSLAEDRALSAAADGELYEDERGFFYFDPATDKARPVARDRAITLYQLGYLQGRVHGERSRWFCLSEKGRAALKLWNRALRQGFVQHAARESRHGVSAARRRSYLLLAHGHPVEGRPRRTEASGAPATAADAPRREPDPAAVWEDEGGACPDVEAERRAAPAPEPAGEPAPETFVGVAQQAARMAVAAADSAMDAVCRSRARETSRLEEAMHAAHQAATEAERYAHMAAEDAAAGQVRTLRGFAARAIECARQAQQKAGVECTAAHLAERIEQVRTAAERAEAERERRGWEAAYEAEQRAETGMDADNRLLLVRAQYTAEEVVPSLGWSVGMVRAMEIAEAGRLYRRDGFAWNGGRKVARERVLMLARAGFLAIGRGADRRITVTPMGAVALYLARLRPEGVHPDDRAAYDARLKACRRTGRSKEETKTAARRLPPLDPFVLRNFVRPVTLVEQEARAAREAEEAAQVWEDEGGAVPGATRQRAADTVASAPLPAPASVPPSGEQLALLPLETVRHRHRGGTDGPVVVVVVPCSAGKLPHPAPAGQLYTGGLHRMARAAAEALTADGGRVLVLSGQRRVFSLDEVVEPYDEVMPEQLTAGDVEQLHAEARRHRVSDAERVVLLTPGRYTRAARTVWPHATAVLEGSSGIGVMRGRLAEISRTGRLPGPPVAAADEPDVGDSVAHVPGRGRPRRRSRSVRVQRSRADRIAPRVTRASKLVSRGNERRPVPSAGPRGRRTTKAVSR